MRGAALGSLAAALAAAPVEGAFASSAPGLGAIQARGAPEADCAAGATGASVSSDCRRLTLCRDGEAVSEAECGTGMVFYEMLYCVEEAEYDCPVGAPADHSGDAAGGVSLVASFLHANGGGHLIEDVQTQGAADGGIGYVSSRAYASSEAGEVIGVLSAEASAAQVNATQTSAMQVNTTVPVHAEKVSVVMVQCKSNATGFSVSSDCLRFGLCDDGNVTAEIGCGPGTIFDIGRLSCVDESQYTCPTMDKSASIAPVEVSEVSTAYPTQVPTHPPTTDPTQAPTQAPTTNPTPVPSASPTIEADVVQVAIIGGGVAGLMAARTLELAGITDWIILEGDEKVGGRARTEEWSGTKINTGGYYVAGNQNGNPFWEYTQRLGVRTREISYDTWITYGEGEERWDKMEKASSCMDSTAMEMNDAFDATGQYQHMTARQVLQNCGWNLRSAMDRAVEWNYYDWEYGRNPNDLSIYASPAYSHYDFGMTQYLISDDEGIEKFVDGIIGDFVSVPYTYDPRFRLNNPVNTILTKSTRCPKNLSSNCVEILLESGNTVFAEHAILTASFGVINRTHRTLLPQGFPGRSVLDKFTMGYFEKFYFRFRNKFWDHKSEFILDSMEGHPVLMWHPRPHQQESQEYVLQVTMTGEEAKTFVNWTKDEIQNYLMFRLDLLYPGSFTGADLVDRYFTDWASSQSYYGAWFEYGPQASPADYLQLVQPEGNLIFSGEMSCKRYYGYVQGAMIAGERDANQVLAKLGKEAYDDRRCD